MGKLENIFLTQLHADTLGGLLGMYLTLADSGNRRLSIHGPPGVAHFLSAGKPFCENRQDSELRAAEINVADPSASLHHDNLVSIQPIPSALGIAPDAPASARDPDSFEPPEHAEGADDMEDDAEVDAVGETGVGGEPAVAAQAQKTQAGDGSRKRNQRRGGGGGGCAALYSSSAVSYVLRFADQVCPQKSDYSALLLSRGAPTPSRGM